MKKSAMHSMTAKHDQKGHKKLRLEWALRPVGPHSVD